MYDEQPVSWWVQNRDRVILGAAVAMFSLLFWSVPKELAAVRVEHKALLSAVQIQCVHAAKDQRERTECMTLMLLPE